MSTTGFKVAKIISMVEKTRKAIGDKWRTPNTSQSLLWAFSELGEFAETIVVETGQWARNNAPKNYDPPEKEFSQFLIMLATATLNSRQKDEACYVESNLILSIILDIEFSKINAPHELLLRSVTYAEKYFPDWDCCNLVELECNRLEQKYTS
jgi:hypothetical protein